MERMRCRMGVVTSPVGRYHPAVIAQAAATLENLYPGRFWMAVGSGEALNESITGAAWPSKAIRNERLREAVQVMRDLWAGEEVSSSGLVDVRQARLHTLPARAPRVLLAALSAGTARWGAPWADGLITVGTPSAPVAQVIRAFREGGGEGKPVLVQVKLSYAPGEQEALLSAHDQWKCNALSREESEDLATPRQFEQRASTVTPADVARVVHVSADPEQHRAWLQAYLDLGVDELYLHNVNRRQAKFIHAFGRDVIAGLA
jgi:G6PDH family F420-dependent oxidoreductase